MDKLLQSRRFWTLVLDTVVSLLLFFVGKYAGAALDDVKFLVLTLQPIFVMLIAAFTTEDVAAMHIAAR